MVAIENINAYITCLILKTSCAKEVRGVPFALLFKRTPEMVTTFCLTVPVVKKNMSYSRADKILGSIIISIVRNRR